VTHANIFLVFDIGQANELATSDQQLLAKFQLSGKPDDLNELMARHLNGVRNLAYRMVLCNATADDITQDVFMQVIRHADKFQGKSKFSTWLYQITMNTIKVHFRKQEKTPTLLGGNDLPHLAHKESPPDQKVIGAELNGQIEQALGQLSTKLRAAIVLTAVERLPAKKAATIEGCSTATMHWRVHQARKELKQHLHRYFNP